MQRLKTKLGLGKQASGSGRKDPVPETILGRIGIRVQAMHIFGSGQFENEMPHAKDMD